MAICRLYGTGSSLAPAVAERRQGLTCFADTTVTYLLFNGSKFRDGFRRCVKTSIVDYGVRVFANSHIFRTPLIRVPICTFDLAAKKTGRNIEKGNSSGQYANIPEQIKENKSTFGLRGMRSVCSTVIVCDRDCLCPTAVRPSLTSIRLHHAVPVQLFIIIIIIFLEWKLAMKSLQGPLTGMAARNPAPNCLMRPPA